MDYKSLSLSLSLSTAAQSVGHVHGHAPKKTKTKSNAALQGVRPGVQPNVGLLDLALTGTPLRTSPVRL